MKRKVMLSIQGQQRYPGQEPETIELVTEGTMEFRDGGWDICYQESELTGLKGVMVPIEETIRGFNMIMDGEVDQYPEAAFNLVGTIDEAIAKGEELLKNASI